MKKITAKKQELIKILEDNLKKHNDDYQEALEGYKEKAITRQTPNNISNPLPNSHILDVYIFRASPVQSYTEVRYRLSDIINSPGLALRGQFSVHSPQ